jgi:D-alanyl-D-alanine carboxypeptidase (penicillin-binding protein 5/6)
MDLMFREFKLYRLFDEGEPVDQANVWLGKAPKVDLVLEEPLHLVLSRTDRRRMTMSLQWSDPVPAPIAAGQKVGTLVLELPDETIEFPLTAASNIAELGMFDRVGEALKYLIFGAGADSIQFQ